MIPEPFLGVTLLIGGWALGSASKWVSKRGDIDGEHKTALALLTKSISHLDTTIGRLDASLDRLWDRYNDHEHRLSFLEGGTPETSRRKPTAPIPTNPNP